MVRGLLWVALGPALVSQTHSHPVDLATTPTKLSFSAKTERSWLWGWAWGAESTVSVVDRSPILSFPSRPGISTVLVKLAHLTPYHSSRLWRRDR